MSGTPEPTFFEKIARGFQEAIAFESGDPSVRLRTTTFNVAAGSDEAKLFSLRHRLRMSPAEFGKLAGLDAQTVLRIEAGEVPAPPGVGDLLALATAADDVLLPLARGEPLSRVLKAARFRGRKVRRKGGRGKLRPVPADR